ncbi:MAG: hypothetical protein Kow006_14060 [Gammaproteobacteria bacterium]
MTGVELKARFDAWGVSAAEGAKVLCLHTGKLSEYLSDVTPIPCAVAFHVEAISLLDPEVRAALIERRRRRRAHSR